MFKTINPYASSCACKNVNYADVSFMASSFLEMSACSL